MGILAELLEHTVPKLECDLPVDRPWSVAFEKIFVAVSRMEATQADESGCIAVADDRVLLDFIERIEWPAKGGQGRKIIRCPFSPIGLPCPRRPVQNNLPFAF